jgi:hypothetical protein
MYIAIKKILHSNLARYIISVLLGLGLASLFRKACKERNCLVFKGPQIDKLKNKIYKHNDKCYKFKENSSKCGQRDRQVEFETRTESASEPEPK